MLTINKYRLIGNKGIFHIIPVKHIEPRRGTLKRFKNGGKTHDLLN